MTFSGVSFAYPGSQGRLVLEDVNLSCEPGVITAIIGPTGSGKSSLASLVPRFYEPTAGEVLVGGVDVRELDPADAAAAHRPGAAEDGALHRHHRGEPPVGA